MKKRAVAVIACVVAAVVVVPGSTAIAQSQRFPDVPPAHYAFEAVEWAAESGVTAGYGDGTFKPQQPLSKSHAVVFMERYYDEILTAEQSDDFTRADMMVLLKAINDG
ncbi:MAG: S-layer homology domain-containing protein, partial [Acidimicrobiaceae bacterium]|nr:S-layer homology domain-containing protein [Acidimicrobiaceae bacterium]